MHCVILAAGEGKRMRPLTSLIPKVMLPLANRPLLAHLVDEVIRAGIHNFLFVVGYGEQAVRTYFGDGSSFGVSIEYVSQRRQKGTGDALLTVNSLIEGKFLLLNGDVLLRHEDIKKFCRCDAPCLATFTSDHPEDYGAVTIDGKRITGLQEKSRPPISTTINAGAYVLNTDIFSHLEKVQLSPRGEIELTDALYSLISLRDLKAFPLSYWRDIGYPWDLLDANNELITRMESRKEGCIEEGVVLNGLVSIGKGSVIKSGTYIEGPCIIGENCRIGPHAYIRGSTSIGNNCHIGHCTEVKNSIIMQSTNAPHFNYIGDSVIGCECNLGAGTKIANLRHDRATVKIMGKDTRKIKFGAILGDHIQLGINCSVNVGSVLGRGVLATPHSYIDGVYGDGSVVR